MNVSFRDTIAVRKGEELNEEILQKFICENIVEAPIGDLEIEQFGAGHSNLTYLLRIGNGRQCCAGHRMGLLQRKPMIWKENIPFYLIYTHYFRLHLNCISFRMIIQSLAALFIMERRKGILLDKEFPLHLHYDKELGRKISEHMVDKLVELHQVDYTKTELLNISQPNGFMERQVAGWIKRYEHAKTDKISGVEELTTWLLKNIPVSPKPTVIHYDYKLNNTMFSEVLIELQGYLIGNDHNR
ncbi:phosphotransferase family protein [[Brevibacterium] frigoritolerans]|uniref:Phosphotransferase family protein n=1 Tax=Peribacillus frigoritolerans TaxID=450367 RepID=A0A941FKQ7_9BACI|nr:phosphotransferase family protein [Peribacillus frigoritolerans]